MIFLTKNKSKERNYTHFLKNMPMWRELGLREPLMKWKPWRVGIWGRSSTNISSFSRLNSRSSCFVPPASLATSHVIVTISSNMLLVIIPQSINSMCFVLHELYRYAVEKSQLFVSVCVEIEYSKSWGEKLKKFFVCFAFVYIWVCGVTLWDDFVGLCSIFNLRSTGFVVTN